MLYDDEYMNDDLINRPAHVDSSNNTSSNSSLEELAMPLSLVDLFCVFYLGQCELQNAHGYISS